MQSEDNGRHQTPRNRQARALTRAIDMVSEDFIEKFVQTGIDDGPEKAIKTTPSVELHMRQVREAREARAAREAKEAENQHEKTECAGFASLLARANTESAPSAFARLLDDHSELESNADGFKPGCETTADGSVIRVKDAGRKKRGLYTSCMEKPNLSNVSDSGDCRSSSQSITDQMPSEVGMRKPSAEQIEAATAEAALVNAARAEARLQAKQAAEQEKTCCPLVKNVFQPIAALWQKLKCWKNSKAS